MQQALHKHNTAFRDAHPALYRTPQRDIETTQPESGGTTAVKNVFACFPA